MSEFPRIIAHRGASSLAPENTMAAFVKAMEVGARWFEFDVDIIGDGTLLVIHDETLDRTTDSSGSYYGLTYSDLRKIDAGKWFSPTYRFERIPEVASVIEFANAHNMGINLEIKPCFGGETLRDRLLENIVAAIDAFTHQSQLLVSSFDHQMLGRFHEARPDIALGWLFERDGLTKHWKEGAAELGCTSVHPDVEGLTSEEVEEIHDAGFEVNVWTVNDLETARTLASWGVDGIFTDRPQDFPLEALNQ
ncbi:MAG: glycerophosphoryl diester phosphodiesterase [Actinobacteria bacterium]|nr:MAG: glycerophosphoryl diester phosphodiesterase [Actinomycetota bacterium]